MNNRTISLVVGISVVGIAAVVAVGVSLNSDNAVSRLNAVASAVAAIGSCLAFFVLVVYTAETYRLRIAAERQLKLQHRVQGDQVKLKPL